jgi:hypothetical protein
VNELERTKEMLEQLNELMGAVVPFLNTGQEALPQAEATTSFEVEGLNHLLDSVENRVGIPPNTQLRDIARSAVPVLTHPLGAGQGLPEPSSESSGRETDSFGIQVLLESFSEKGGESSVNQPPADPVDGPVPEEAAISPRVVPYPYLPDEVIGGDSVEAIERRLLAAKTPPSYFDLMQARIDAKDLFEKKVEIVRVMSGLHPQGDWLGQGARALDNPSGTGEHTFGYLSNLLSDLESGGTHSDSFKRLTGKVFLKRYDDDDHSAT